MSANVTTSLPNQFEMEMTEYQQMCLGPAANDHWTALCRAAVNQGYRVDEWRDDQSRALRARCTRVTPPSSPPSLP
jgi:hypothetical protein